MSTPASDQTAPLSAIGEREVVALIRNRFPADPALLLVGIGDDAAVAVPAPRQLEVLTTDALVEGIHFDRAYSSLIDIGYKALAVNVSDIAAMGGKPRLALVSLMLPAVLTVVELDQLLDGIALMASEVGVTVAGGNITKSPGPLVIDVALTGTVGPRRFLTRSGGRPGDRLYVTGAVGAAAAGLGWLRSRGREAAGLPEDPDLVECVIRQRRPEPRTRLGSLLGRTKTASACMDLSDGLANAVTQLALSSGTGAAIEAGSLPVPKAAARWFASQNLDPVTAAIDGGDDYELLFAVPPRHGGRLRMVLQQSRGVPVTRIGELTSIASIVLIRNGNAEVLPEGFTHF